MQKSKLFFLILTLFIIALTCGLYWFENQEASPENNEYLPLPDSLIQKIQSQDSLEKANFLNAPPPNMQSISKDEMIFEQKKDAYTFQIFNDSLGTKIIALFGTKTIAEIRDNSIKNIIKAETSDLNSNSYPEILVYSRKDNKLVFIGYEAQNGFQKFTLPPLMGRQSFGYAGKDTLFVENNNLIRRFQFRNAQFASFPSGTRICEYSLGHDLRFTMVRTLDTE
jgi:hypothetical protein